MLTVNKNKLNQQESEVVQLVRKTDNGLQRFESSEKVTVQGHGVQRAKNSHAACRCTQCWSWTSVRRQYQVPCSAILSHCTRTKLAKLTASLSGRGEEASRIWNKNRWSCACPWNTKFTAKLVVQNIWAVLRWNYKEKEKSFFLLASSTCTYNVLSYSNFLHKVVCLLKNKNFLLVSIHDYEL